MSEHETIAEIIAEMRNEGHTGPADALEWVRVKMTHYADLLDAAHKREVVALRTRVDMLRFGIEQYRQYHAGVVKKYESKICDTAKLREAVDYCRDEVADLIHDIGGYEEDMERRMKELVSKCNAALAATATAEKSSAVGDCAKLREALIDVVKRLEAYVGCDHHTLHPTATTCDGITSVGKCCKIGTCVAIFNARAALAAPPRNCDRPECATTKAAQDVWRKEDGGETAYYEWLLATYKEGGNDGR